MAMNTESDERPTKRARIGEPDEPSSYVLRERSCGISALLNPESPCFSGTLKLRYSDFIVNEVDLNGDVVRLRSLDPPKFQSQPKERQEPPSSPKQAQSSATADTAARLLQDWSDSDTLRGLKEGKDDSTAEDMDTIVLPGLKTNLERLCRIFGDEITNQMIKLVLQQSIRKSAATITTEPMPDRSLRTEAHMVLREAFSSALDSTTQGDQTIAISVNRHASGGSSRPSGQGRRQSQNQPQQGDFLHFTVYKENRDTAEVKSFLTKQMKLKSNRFDYAGTKDRRAITSQRCSIYKMNLNQLRGVAKRMKGVVVGDYEYKSRGLQLGQTGGNAFVITLKDAHAFNEQGLAPSERKAHLEAASTTAVSAMAQSGFINYYGLQRFGTFQTSTSFIGMQILQGDLKGAVDSILSYHPSHLEQADEENTESTSGKTSDDDKQRAISIARWRETGNSRDSLKIMPRRFHAEMMLIEHLSSRSGERANDYQGAIMTIPRQTRTLYLHAYQSLVWNHMATARWEHYGNQVVEGDVVLDHASIQTANPSLDYDDTGEPIVNPSADDAPTEESKHTRGRHITAAEAAAGTYTIKDIVLPLPGHDVLYPTNAIGEEYVKFMASEQGGHLDPHSMRRTWKDASLTGEYRHLIHFARDMSSEVVEYGSNEEQLVETDLDLIKSQRLREQGQEMVIKVDEEGETERANADEEGGVALRSEGEEVERGERKLAVVLRFKLGAGTYATMALREIMGAGNCKEYQPEFSGRR